MNVIIVAKPFSTPKVLRFTHWRAYTFIGIGIGAVFALAIGVGALVGTKMTGPAAARAELDQARQEIERQRAELARLDQSMNRDVTALTLRLGKLQAEATRLNALGERLAKMGKLEDGEFDFRQEPALGGPVDPRPVRELSAGDVASAVDKLESQLARQARQLTMLEAMLLDREIDESLLPAGIPVRSGYASSHYGNRSDPFTGKPDFHPGVDFNGQRGADILAVASGVVSFSGRKPQYGNVVEIDHGNGYLTRYAHNDKNVVEVGDPVRVGEVIAKMGSTGRATGVHVHFEVWHNGRLVNPSQYIHAMR
jgi:murein DD-endopeptidase MepM/ murein hydrolase activator NlpD